ncbi:MAG: Ig-like domain-containing protein [Tissierellales bacterium]|nr:Ig-like domain-containing protein [Tissierellales bacterium]
MTNRHEWFVSRLGFNVPIELDASLIEEQDPGRLYPIFPNDYDLIPIDASTNNFNYSSINTFEEEYTGRHIVYTVTPFATSGKKGETVFSQPVFLHGPTVTDDLVLHLDANMISRDTSISDITYDGEIILLDEWEDLTENNNDAPTSSTAKPVLEEVQYQEDAFSWGKSLIQNEDESTIMEVSSFSNSPSDEMTLIFVAKIYETNIGSNIMSGNNWSFDWNGSGNLSFNFGGDPATAPIDDKWHVFSCIVSSGNVDFRIDGISSKDTGTTGVSNPCDSNPFSINLDGVDIAEILIYNDDLNSIDLDEVESQIINKYDPDPADILTNIMYIKSLPARTVIKNESFTPPNPVEAVMTNGTTQNINVTWNNTVDTSVVGTYNISATADIDNTKSVNLVVNVVEIDYLEHHVTPPIIIEKNTEDYNLPTNLNAKLTNGNDRIVEVTWTSNEADISVAGGILKGTEVGDYTNAITATANLDSTKSIDYDVNVEKSYLVEFYDYDGTEFQHGKYIQVFHTLLLVQL